MQTNKHLILKFLYYSLPQSRNAPHTSLNQSSTDFGYTEYRCGVMCNNIIHHIIHILSYELRMNNRNHKHTLQNYVIQHYIALHRSSYRVVRGEQTRELEE